MNVVHLSVGLELFSGEIGNPLQSFVSLSNVVFRLDLVA